MARRQTFDSAIAFFIGMPSQPSAQYRHRRPGQGRLVRGIVNLNGKLSRRDRQ